MTDPVEKALDALDWDYGGDMVDYLGEGWRDALRPHIKAAVDASTERLREDLAGKEREVDDKSELGHAVADAWEAAADAWKAEATRLRGLLARLEWAGNGAANSRCPVCRARPYSERNYAHVPGCWLAAELQRAGGAESS